MTDRPLAGRCIAMPESREVDLFAAMLEKRGATVMRCPLVAIRDAPEAGPVEAWIDELIAGRMRYVVLYTGEGLRRLRGFAERRDQRDAFVAALARVRKVTRGPKPVKALRDMGLRPDVQAAAPTTAGIIETLSHESLNDVAIGVQLYGSETNKTLMHFLHERGALPRVVWPYVYASEADDARVLELMDSLAAGKVDLIAFTGSPQVRRLFDVAEAHGRVAELRTALTRIKVAAVGPVVAQALGDQRVRVDVMPERRYSLRPLTDAMIEALDAQQARPNDA